LAESPHDIVDVDQNNPTFDQQVLAALGFLGGIAFAGLVFILSTPDSFRVPVGFLSANQYFGFLTTVLATASVFCIFSAVGLASVGSSEPDLTKWSGPFSLICTLVGICALLIAIPLLLFPFTLYGAYVISVLEAILLIFALRFRTF
jgi:hypothetical protein